MRAAAFRNEEDQKTIQWIVFPTHGFELGEGHFDRVQVGRVGRQEDQVVALGAQKRDGARRFVRGQVVGDDNLARSEGWGQFVLDLGLKADAVHCAVQHPGSQQTVATKARDEG